jgi:predicted amidohydrolase
MKVGHFQCEVIPGSFEDNLKTVMRGLKQAAEEQLEIISFPESLLTGYFGNEQQARQNGFAIDAPEINGLLNEAKDFESTFMVGFNELRNDKIYNSVLIAEQGRLLGVYSKAFPCYDYFEPGRDFPVFQRGKITFGVVICADGGYIEPARILALKGAQVIFAPHYNYIAPENVVDHYHTSRSDHVGRVIENGIWFVRGNNFVPGYDKGLDYEGIGVGDSYILAPTGRILAGSYCGCECLISATIDLESPIGKNNAQKKLRSEKSAGELGPIVMELISEKQ